mgnify:CR=1 FL=1
MINFFKKHWEVLSYLVFGVLCTLLNIVLYALFNKLFGYTAANSWGNVLDNIICILFAYCTNRAFVFRSKTQGKAMAREFGAFVTCRLGTMLLDTAIMLVLGNLLAAQGAALMTETTFEKKFIDGVADTISNNNMYKQCFMGCKDKTKGRSCERNAPLYILFARLHFLYDLHTFLYGSFVHRDQLVMAFGQRLL